MEIRDITDVLAGKLGNYTREGANIVHEGVKSVHFGEADQQDVQNAQANPRSLAAAAGIETTDESQYHLSFMQRQDRHKPTMLSRSARRPIIIVIHYECCCGDIIVLGW